MYSVIQKRKLFIYKNSILAGCTALVVATSCTQRAVEKQTWVEKAIIRVVSIIADTLTGGAAFFPAVYGICMN